MAEQFGVDRAFGDCSADFSKKGRILAAVSVEKIIPNINERLFLFYIVLMCKYREKYNIF